MNTKNMAQCRVYATARGWRVNIGYMQKIKAIHEARGPLRGHRRLAASQNTRTVRKRRIMSDQCHAAGRTPSIRKNAA